MRYALSSLHLPIVPSYTNAQKHSVSTRTESASGFFAPGRAYAFSKACVNALTRILARENPSLLINACCPGWVKTEMDVADQASGSYSDDDITGVNPMGRFAAPGDIAQAILFLADGERSGFVNGHALAVDGGWTTDASWQSLRLSHR